MNHLAVVLHAHLPFVRHPEHERSHEEQWLFEAIWETYLPLLSMLERLEREGVPYGLTLSISPTLACLLSDEFLKSRFEQYLEAQKQLVQRLRDEPNLSGFELPLLHYAIELEKAQEAFRLAKRDVLRSLVKLAEHGRLEIMTTSVSHAYLPGLLPRPNGIREQISLGLSVFEQLSGRRPVGFWLPECAYHPQLATELREASVRYTLVDSHGLEHASPRSPFGTYLPVIGPSDLLFFGRDPMACRDIWSREVGYPSHPDYREFYRDVGFDLPLASLGLGLEENNRRMTGIKLHRVTGPNRVKLPYDPTPARVRARLDAIDFVERRSRDLSPLGSQLSAPLSVACFDAELFGHWWFEGIHFLEEVFRELARKNSVRAATLSGYLDRHSALPRAEPAASSWGEGGYGSVWLSDRTAPYWPPILRYRTRVERAFETGNSDRFVLAMARMELLLLEASDWLFMIDRDDYGGYARQRISEHSNNISRLLGCSIEQGQEFARNLAQQRGRLAEIIARLN